MNANQDFSGAAEAAAPTGMIFDEASRETPIAPIAPILAGARARGVADAFEMLGIAAILVAADGAALFVNRRARALLGPDLAVTDGRLFAAKRADQAALAGLMETALAGPRRAGALVMKRSGRAALRLSATPVVEDDDPYQLLSAVVVLQEEAA